jgi:methionyl-tRNA synthetase
METNYVLQIINDPTKMQWLFLLMIWTIPWKGFALWRAAKNKQLPWFIGILLINTFGIIEIIYLAFFQKKSEEK